MPRDTYTPLPHWPDPNGVIAASFRRALRDNLNRLDDAREFGWRDDFAERRAAHYRKMLTIMGETP